MAQLLDWKREAVEAEPLTAALRAADLMRAVVIMKGAESWIVAPDGAHWHYDGGGVGLATSGSGDVLAGLVAGILARGADPLTAALWGVYLHGEAGARLAKSMGPLGFLAREISSEVPQILRGFSARPSM
jgi:NAD(P)H-hydrate repair Nnr-like enzyme with NAD(P)H-hydrate dehydratase domain